MKWTPDKLAAIILITGCLLLVAFGIDSEVKSILTISAGWVFGTTYSEKRSKR